MRIGKRILKQLAAWKWRLLLAYLLLLAISYVVRWERFHETDAAEVSTMMVPAIKADAPTTQRIRLAYQEYKAASDPNAGVVVLLQGSPGSSRDFAKLGPELAKRYEVVAPDLPGFGSSSHSIPDYSNRAHARYVLEMLDQLHVQRAHFVGFSMGGGVALQIADIRARPSGVAHDALWYRRAGNGTARQLPFESRNSWGATGVSLVLAPGLPAFRLVGPLDARPVIRA